MSSHPTRNCLFVYGTLRRGWDNPYAERLDRESTYSGSAKVNGKLYRIDWYCGVVLGGQDWVIGDVFAGVSQDTLAELDHYEGPDEFHRVEVEAHVPNGERVSCWIYAYVGPVEKRNRIESGEFTRGA